MKKFQSTSKNTIEITFNEGVEYIFIVNKDGIGIRRKDQKGPTHHELDILTQYLIKEGWADHLKHLLDSEEDSW